MSLADRHVLIIGGGIAGLCVGIYLKKNGFDTEILEMHGITGGLATGWKRNGYTFETCIHWLVGSKAGGDLNETWKEVCDIDRIRFHYNDIFQRVEIGGQNCSIYREIDKTEKELLCKAPEDGAAIKKFCSDVRRFASFRFPGGRNPWEFIISLIKIAGYMPLLFKYSRMNMAQLANRFKNPLLKTFFSGGGMTEMSSLAIMFSLGWISSGNGGYPIGGSLTLIGLIEERYLQLGGRIRFGARVEKIITENGRTVGVILKDGEELRADIIVSAADGHATLFQMLEGKYLPPRLKTAYENFTLFPSYLQVSLGVDYDFKNEPGFIVFDTGQELAVDPKTREKYISFRIFNFDPTFAPPGKTAVVSFIPTYNYQYWEDLRSNDKERYKAEKERIASEVMRVLEKRFPAARGKVETIDVSTPATVIRYTGNWRGSMEGWLPTPKTGFRALPGILPGLKDFYMVGQWVSPGGGLPSGLMGGRSVAKRICRDNGVKFTS